VVGIDMIQNNRIVGICLKNMKTSPLEIILRVFKDNHWLILTKY
jgi:hypothetical protein